MLLFLLKQIKGSVHITFKPVKLQTVIFWERRLTSGCKTDAAFKKMFNIQFKLINLSFLVKKLPET